MMAVTRSEQGGGTLAGSTRMSSTLVKLRRSARGRIFSLPRSSGGGITTGSSRAEEVVDERDCVAEVGDDGVGADAQQALALPLVDSARAVVRLVAGHGHRQAANLLGVFDLDVAVAEGEQVTAGDAVSLQNPIDDHLLGELLVVVQGAVDVTVEIAGDVEKAGLALDGGDVGAAGEINRQTEAAQVLEQRAGAVDEQGIGFGGSAGEGSRAGADVRFQPPQVFVLVPSGSSGWPPRSRIRSASWIIW